jgi:hypothetical protein
VVNSRLVRLLTCNAQNILIQELPQPWAEDEKWWVVLGDLGLSRRNEDATGKTTIVGTRQFMAPETIGKPFSGDPTTADPKSADMWCLGETVSYVLTKCPTFPDTEELVQYQQREAEFPDDGLKRKGYSEEVIDFVRSLMKADPPQRLTVSQALEHSWITRMLDRKSVALNTGHYASSTDNLVSGSGTLPENAQIPATPTPPLRAPSATDSNAAKKADFVAQFQEKLRLQDEAEKKAKEASKEASKEDTKSTAKSPSLSKAESFLRESKETVEGREKSPLHDVEQQLSDSCKNFSPKNFSPEEKLRISERQRAFARENKAAKFADLKRFAEKFHLETPIPQDLVPILAKDPEKRERIVESALRHAEEANDSLKPATADIQTSVEIPPAQARPTNLSATWKSSLPTTTPRSQAVLPEAGAEVPQTQVQNDERTTSSSPTSWAALLRQGKAASPILATKSTLSSEPENLNVRDTLATVARAPSPWDDTSITEMLNTEQASKKRRKKKKKKAGNQAGQEG